MNEHEKEWNRLHSAEIDFSKTERSILERRLKSLEDQASKGKAEMSDVRRASEELSAFKDKKPLRYYGDDVTTEKLASMISENDGRAAIFSPEGGIFDLLKGMYTRYVNIDVFLKGYSGDPIRVDRIGRESETIYNPVLTVMFMAQPSVLAGVMENGNFRGRGLTARFLYCVPESNVGHRKYRSMPIPEKSLATNALRTLRVLYLLRLYNFTGISFSSLITMLSLSIEYSGLSGKVIAIRSDSVLDGKFP